MLDSGAADGAWNMALDVALLARARRTGEGVFRVYQWSRPTLSFGRHERAAGRYDLPRLQANGVDTVRRPTGGRALLHDRELTYSVTAPAPDATLAQSYEAIGATLTAAMRSLGIPVAAASPPGRSLRPEGALCFAEPSAGELVVGGRKLIGSAQLREQGALLQHGSILIADDQPRIGTFALQPTPTPAPAATLSELLGASVDGARVTRALFTALTESCAAHGVETVEELRVDDALREEATRERVRFLDPDWTFRR